LRLTLAEAGIPARLNCSPIAFRLQHTAGYSRKDYYLLGLELLHRMAPYTHSLAPTAFLQSAFPAHDRLIRAMGRHSALSWHHLDKTIYHLDQTNQDFFAPVDPLRHLSPHPTTLVKKVPGPISPSSSSGAR
jgi:hypothetical protein